VEVDVSSGSAARRPMRVIFARGFEGVLLKARVRVRRGRARDRGRKAIVVGILRGDLTGED
jgi:hypothetical protein